MAGQNLFITGVKLLLTVTFVHRCIVIFERWSLGRTEKFQTSQMFSGEEPFPAFTFKQFFHKVNFSYHENTLESFINHAYIYSSQGSM